VVLVKVSIQLSINCLCDPIDYQFDRLFLYSITGSVEKLGGVGRSFYKCISLFEVIFEIQIESGSKPKEISRSTFYECDIKSIRVPNNVELQQLK
jgi:hypothetical protein